MKGQFDPYAFADTLLRMGIINLSQRNFLHTIQPDAALAILEKTCLEKRTMIEAMRPGTGGNEHPELN